MLAQKMFFFSPEIRNVYFCLVLNRRDFLLSTAQINRKYQFKSTNLVYF